MTGVQLKKVKTNPGTPYDTTLAPDADKRFGKCEEPRDDIRHDAWNSAPGVAAPIVPTLTQDSE
jgi:hypothetical protein